MIFHCFACENHFEARHFNIARITISCPVCGTNLFIAQSIGRVYGKEIGERASQMLTSLTKTLNRAVKSKSTEDWSPIILNTQRRIEKLCAEAA